jgi:splicing factor 3B subunit 3
MGNRIYATDIQESIHILRYKTMENQLVTFADDTCPRFTVACCVLDYSTICITDKFGNISIVSNDFFLEINCLTKRICLVTCSG